MNTPQTWPTKADITDLRIRAERALGMRVNASGPMQPEAHVKVLTDGSIEYGCCGWAQPQHELVTASGSTPDACFAMLVEKIKETDPLESLRQQANLHGFALVQAP